MKVISFLGTGKYESTTYFWNERESQPTRFFPAAVTELLKPDEILICATPTVRGHANLPELQKKLDEVGAHWRVIEIPEGHSEADLWAIFDALTGAVESGETVAFDVTHSFRSLPFLAFLAVAYLRIARNVQVEHVLYGAWEARDTQTNRSPVFDLTPFVSLLDWTNATNRFLETGDGRPLATLLKAGMPSGPQMGQDLQLRSLGANLRSAAQAIQTVSLALQVTRPMEAMESSAHLAEVLEQALPVFTQKARPFAVLAESVAQEYGQFGLENASEPENFDDGLRRQLKMIAWYLEREQVVQSATLLREWIVSLLAYHFGAAMFDLEGGRNLVEKALNNSVEKRKPAPGPITAGRFGFDEQFEALPQAETLRALWSKVTNLRNDIAHVGMRQNPKTASQLKQKVETLYPQLEQLADQFLPKVD
ncbi:MAG: TIGR02221 family CRISPR-associated protein [Anaerolineales bacterium]|jgi:CRISPR-associated DxTHG motif protein|nr:TIGR02221 family CRISPR-associated protein [Anaerolineales bacterium]